MPPSFFGKLFGSSNNKSNNTFLSTSTRYAYPSNPPLVASGSSLPGAVLGLRDSLPPYPHHEFPFSPVLRNRGGSTANDVDEDVNPFSDANRARMSAIRRSRSQAFNQIGSLLQEENNGAGDSSGQMPRRRANSTTTRPDPSQFLLARPLEPEIKPPPSPVRTKEKCPNCDNVKSVSAKPRKDNKGKARASASTPGRFVEHNTNEDAGFTDRHLYDSSSPEVGGAPASAAKNNAGVVRVQGNSNDKVTKTMKRSGRGGSSGSGSRGTVDVEDFNRRYPPIHSDEEIARALQFYEEFGPVTNGAQGAPPNTTRPDRNPPAAHPVNFPEPEETPKVPTDPYASSSVSSALTAKPKQHIVAAPSPSFVPEASAAPSSYSACSFIAPIISVKCCPCYANLLTTNVDSCSTGIYVIRPKCACRMCSPCRMCSNRS